MQLICYFTCLGWVDLLNLRHENEAFKPLWEQEKDSQEKDQRSKVKKILNDLAKPHHYSRFDLIVLLLVSYIFAYWFPITLVPLMFLFFLCGMERLVTPSPAFSQLGMLILPQLMLVFLAKAFISSPLILSLLPLYFDY